MLQRMPGFSKDIMRTILCTLVFLFSLPWSLNGNLTTSHNNIEVKNTADNASGQINYTTDSGTDNVVSLSKRAQAQHLTTPNSDDETSNQNKGRNIHDGEYNLTTTPAQSERQIIQEEGTTPQEEIQKPTEGSRRLHATSLLQIENATELNALTKPTNATRADVLPEEKPSRGPIETLEGTLETPSSSDFTGHYGGQENKTVMEGNNNNKNGNLHTMDTTDLPSPMTHPMAHTSAIITAKDFNKTVSTNGLKTTERDVVADRWTSTQGPELKTSSMFKPTKTLTTTKKNPAKKIYTPSKDNQKANPGPAVAAVIGTTFVLMFIAIIVILIRKRKKQRKQLENPEWAGPSPFLDGDVQPNLPNMDESETINRQGFNQVSISRYLPQRLSKHLTLGRNTSEEVLMGDILQGSTFGRQNPDEVQAPNRNPTVAQDSTEEEKNEIREGQAPVDSLDTKTSASGSAKEPVMESKVSKQPDDLTPSLSFSMDTIIKPPPLESIDLDSLSEEAAPLQTSDGGIVPPAPPLP